jgi:hypothetical protein
MKLMVEQIGIVSYPDTYTVSNDFVSELSLLPKFLQRMPQIAHSRDYREPS